MPKKIFFESAVHHFVAAGQPFLRQCPELKSLRRFIGSFVFSPLPGHRTSFSVSWTFPNDGMLEVDFSEASLYVRGDNEKFIEKMKERDCIKPEDPIRQRNRDFFEGKFLEAARKAGFQIKEGGSSAT